jgi:hypothetical protein
MRIAVIFLFSTLTLLTGFVISNKKVYPVNSKKIEIRGIYGNPDPFWKKNLNLSNVQKRRDSKSLQSLHR